MNKFAKLVFAASAVVAFSAQAQTAIQAKPNSAYIADTRGVILNSGTGLCWRSGYWTPGDAVPGCDGEIAKVAAAPAPKPAPAPVPAAPTSEKVTFSADTLFDFDKAVLTADGKKELDELASRMKDTNLEVVIAVGHSDAIGSDAYNQKLSMRRAEAVKSYLVSQGIEGSRAYTEGRGERQPVADNKSAEGRARNRRVEVEVVGIRTRGVTTGASGASGTTGTTGGGDAGGAGGTSGGAGGTSGAGGTGGASSQ